MQIVAVPMLNDNYGYLIHEGGTTVAVDPTEAHPMQTELSAHGWKLDAVLNTHHHWDHVGGNPELRQAYRCPVYVPRGDESRVAGATDTMVGGERLQIGKLVIDVLFIPGHTQHHVALWLSEHGAVFTGDTLFLRGCGRLFEGTAEQMWESLRLLASLPDSTRVYCGHEYTEANAKFAAHLTPDDAFVVADYKVIQEKRRRGEKTIPGTIAQEKALNPFLRLADTEYRNRLFPNQDAVQAFAALRKRKDDF